MSTSLSAHNGCVSMFRTCPLWNTWDKSASFAAVKTKSRPPRFEFLAEVATSTKENKKKNRAPALRIERLRHDFVALARENVVTTPPVNAKIVLTKTTSPTTTTATIDEKRRAIPPSKKKDVELVRSGGDDFIFGKEWIFVDEGDGDDGVVDDQLDWVFMSDDDDDMEVEREKLSYAQVAQLAKDWDLSGDGTVVDKIGVSPSKRPTMKKACHKEDIDVDVEVDESLFVDEWERTKSYGEHLYHQRKAFKAKRRKSKE